MTSPIESTQDRCIVACLANESKVSDIREMKMMNNKKVCKEALLVHDTKSQDCEIKEKKVTNN